MGTIPLRCDNDYILFLKVRVCCSFNKLSSLPRRMVSTNASTLIQFSFKLGRNPRVKAIPVLLLAFKWRTTTSLLSHLCSYIWCGIWCMIGYARTNQPLLVQSAGNCAPAVASSDERASIASCWNLSWVRSVYLSMPRGPIPSSYL